MKNFITTFVDKLRGKPQTSGEEMPFEVKQKIAQALKQAHLFSMFTEEELLSITHYFQEQNLAANTTFIHENEKAVDVFILLSGEAEVIKQEKYGQRQHHIGVIHPGEIVGELALIDNAPRSASVKTTEASSILTISIADLREVLNNNPAYASRSYYNLAKELNHRLKSINEDAVEALRRSLYEATMRNAMGRFMSYILLIIFMYVYIMHAIQVLSHSVFSTTIISVPLLVLFGGIAVILMYHNGQPFASYGLTLKNVKRVIQESIIYSIPIMILLCLGKYLLIHYIPQYSSEPLFDNPLFGHGVMKESIGVFIVLMCCYALAVPLQEILCRGAIQGSMQIFFMGRYRYVLAILLANFGYSIMHIHLSLMLSILVFPLGLFWGWLFYKQRSIFGVIVSHILIGVWAMFLLNFKFLQ